jgi:hypothetical protein
MVIANGVQDSQSQTAWLCSSMRVVLIGKLLSQVVPQHATEKQVPNSMFQAPYQRVSTAKSRRQHFFHKCTFAPK